MRTSRVEQLSYLGVLVAAIVVGSLVVAQPWATSAPGVTETGDGGRNLDDPRLAVAPFAEIGVTREISVEHLPAPMQGIGPDPVVLKSSSLRLCGASFGPHSLQRAFCDSVTGEPAFLMSVALSPEQLATQNPGFDPAGVSPPEGAVSLTLADGSEAAFFADAGPSGLEVEGAGVVESSAVGGVKLILGWTRSSGDYFIKLSTVYSETSLRRLAMPDLVTIANSVNEGRPLMAVSVPPPETLIAMLGKDFSGVIDALNAAGLQVQVIRESALGSAIGLNHDLVVFGEQYWVISDSTFEVLVG